MSKNIKSQIKSKYLSRPFSADSLPRKNSNIWLDKNENLDPYLQKIINSVASKVPSISYNSYPEAAGLYVKLSKWLKVPKKSIILTHGSDGAIKATFELFISPGDKVIHMDPTFAMYPVYCKIFGALAKKITYKRKENKPYINVDDVINIINNEKPKLFCLANPDSPTGSVFSKNNLKKIILSCQKNNTIVLIDEAYHPFSKVTAIHFVKEFDNIIIARTFSKAWGLAGLRIGYLVSSEAIINYFNKIRPMYEVSTYAIAFVEKMMDYKNEMYDSVKRLINGKLFFEKEMNKLGYNVINCDGNFLHVDFRADKEAIHRKLKNKVLYRIDFNDECLVGYSRFSATTINKFKIILKLIKDAVKKK